MRYLPAHFKIPVATSFPPGALYRLCAIRQRIHPIGHRRRQSHSVPAMPDIVSLSRYLWYRAGAMNITERLIAPLVIVCLAMPCGSSTIRIAPSKPT